MFVSLNPDSALYWLILKAYRYKISIEQLSVIFNMTTYDVRDAIYDIQLNNSFEIPLNTFQRMTVADRILSKILSGKKLFMNPVFFSSGNEAINLLDMLLSGNYSDLLFIDSFLEENDQLGTTIKMQAASDY